MDGHLDTKALAARLGVQINTVYIYRTRGDLPPEDETVGRSPLWREDTIARWIAARPGRGGRRHSP